MLGNLKPIDQLSIRHQLFILGYLIHKGDKTKAARHAGCPTKRAKEQGYQLYTKLHLYIDPFAKELVQAHALNAEQVVQGLSLLSSSDITDYLTWDSKNNVVLKDSSELTPAQRYCVESVEQHETQFSKTIKLRLAKKQPALDSLAQFHNLFRRSVASKGLWVTFEEGTTQGAGTTTTRAVLEHTRRKVEVVFEDAPVKANGKEGNGHG